MNPLQLIGLLSGALHVPLALTVWSLLVRRTGRGPLLLWVAGALMMGLGTALFAARGQVPAVLSYEVAMGLTFAAVPLRVMALRIDLDLPPRAGLAALLWGLAMAAYLAGLRLVGEPLSVPLSLLYMIPASAVFGWHAWRAGQAFPSRSGRILAWAEWLFSAALGLRLVAVLAGWTPARGITNSWDLGLVALTSLVAAFYGNVGYLGMVLDRSNARERQALAAGLAEAARREVAEARTAELAQLLDQRDALARERERLLQRLAHQVRQPLHNASGALQSAAAVMAPEPALPADVLAYFSPVQQRLARAQAVLGQVQGVLDNTLAAAQLLVRDRPLLKVDTELDYFVALVLGDLDIGQRHRVHLLWRASYRSVEMEPGLMRLALRNLLVDALRRVPGDAPVWLTLADQAAPPALCLQLSAQPGLAAPDALLAVAAPDAVPPDEADVGPLLAHQVLAANGGQLRHAGQGGAWALPWQLVLAQPQDEAADPV